MTEPDRGTMTSPLGLAGACDRPGPAFNATAFVDLFLIALFFIAAGSRFVLSPGLDLALPSVDAGVVSHEAAAAVLTVRSEQALLFEGEIFRPGALESRLRTFVEAGRAAAGGTAGPVLLVRLDGGMPVGLLLEITEAARAAGFERVQVAAEPRRGGSGGHAR